MNTLRAAENFEKPTSYLPYYFKIDVCGRRLVSDKADLEITTIDTGNG